MPTIIPIQTEFTTPRAFIKGGPEYDAMIHDLDFISDSIRASGVETQIMQFFIDRASKSNNGKKLSRKKYLKHKKEPCSFYMQWCCVII